MEVNNSKRFDVVIVGGGVAGISAALWCRELGLKHILLESANELGGQLLWTYNAIKNHLGIESANGRELREKILDQIKPLDLNIETGCEVVRIDAANKEVTLKDGRLLKAWAIVIATGVSRRKLNLEGEEGLKGKGILESGKRDAEKVAGKTVCVVGGGDAALENALILSEFAEKVFLIHRRSEFRSRIEFLEKAQKTKNVEILKNQTIHKIIGKERLESIEVWNPEESKATIIPTDFLLLRLGVVPNTKLIAGQIIHDENRYCKINENCETSVENVYAIGDVANPLAPTVSGAIGMGASVAKIIASKISRGF